MGRNLNKNEYLAGYNSLSLNLQPIYDLAEICHQAGISDAILSPGSRCAPLVLAFARHPSIKVKTISDERTAAFIALGIAQGTQRPVVLACTSGSAAYNYAPAVAEAFFRKIPLVVLTADRPPEWIGQQDGQTIWQEQLYGKHVCYSGVSLPDLSHPDARWFLKRVMNEALNTAIEQSGPVHINLPFREPFYPDKDEDFFYESEKQFIPHHRSHTDRLENTEVLNEIWQQSAKKLIVIGQMNPSEQEIQFLEMLIQSMNIPVVGDITSNIHKANGAIQRSDVFLNHLDPEHVRPDLLITFGGAILSKKTKAFFRKHPPAKHWHIQESGNVPDTFQSITDVLKISPGAFLRHFAEQTSKDSFSKQKQENYFRLWEMESDRSARHLEDHFSSGENFGEFDLVYETMKRLPEHCNLHLANSMAVRYANFCGVLSENKDITVFSNRGTCGIDGCTSTAVGTSLADPDRLNVLITGDLAFFYDRNAFWHKYELNNLRIIVLNNHGGGIFRMIQGPSSLPELEPYFETEQPLNARAICSEFNIEYMACNKRSKTGHFLNELMAGDNRIKLLELESDSKLNARILSSFNNSF